MMALAVSPAFPQSPHNPGTCFDLGPHCGRKSSVNRVNVMSALHPKADVGLLDYLRSANDPKEPLLTDQKMLEQVDQLDKLSTCTTLAL